MSNSPSRVLKVTMWIGYGKGNALETTSDNMPIQPASRQDAGARGCDRLYEVGGWQVCVVVRLVQIGTDLSKIDLTVRSSTLQPARFASSMYSCPFLI